MSSYGYRFISIGYRLSPKNKYPVQIEDICNGYNCTLNFLKGKNINTSKIIISGPSASAHLTSILVYDKQIQNRMNVDLKGVIGYIGVQHHKLKQLKQTFLI